MVEADGEMVATKDLKVLQEAISSRLRPDRQVASSETERDRLKDNQEGAICHH